VEEEAPSSRGCRHALNTLPRPELLIAGEPSGWDRYTLGYKGRVSARLEAARSSAHTSREEPSAPELLLEAYAEVRRWVELENAGARGGFDRLQVTLRRLESVDAGLLETCNGEVVFRLPPRWTAVALSRYLRDMPLGPNVRLTPMSTEEPVHAEN